MLAGHELLPFSLERGHGFRFQHLVPPRAEAGLRVNVGGGRADGVEPAKIAEGPLSLDGAVAMAMLCPEPAWLRVLGFACKWTYKTHMLGRSCEHCLVGELEKRLLRCSRCKAVYFCDRACQRAGHARSQK